MCTLKAEIEPADAKRSGKRINAFCEISFIDMQIAHSTIGSPIFSRETPLQREFPL
jgi:hypothetical protein